VKDYRGPCYSLVETQQLLNLNPTELRYEIDNKAIQAVVYTKPRMMLLFQRGKDEGWTGFGKCQYRGHYSLHLSVVQRLLDNEKIHIGKGSGRLLDHNGISHLTTDYPFKMDLPHDPFTAWRTLEAEAIKTHIDRLAATPFPKEGESGLKMFEDFMITIAEDLGKKENAENYKRQYQGPELVLNFNIHSEFKPEDLRIPKSEIDRFITSLELQQTEAKAEKAVEKITRLKPQQRESQLHHLVNRILDTEPKIAAKRAWALIEQDASSDEPVFDSESILQQVDADCIEWCSRNGAEQSLTWGSFQGLLSKLKKSRQTYIVGV